MISSEPHPLPKTLELLPQLRAPTEAVACGKHNGQSLTGPTPPGVLPNQSQKGGEEDCGRQRASARGAGTSAGNILAQQP